MAEMSSFSALVEPAAGGFAGGQTARMAHPPVRGLPGIGRCRVWGVLNVTPDSFSDGGLHLRTEDAIRHGLQLLAAEADVVDVGGESTRPGAQRVSAAEERDRVLPVISALAAAGAVVSIDTMRAETALAALDAGAQIVNDVSGGLADPDMAPAMAGAGAPFVAMHWRGPSDLMHQLTSYGDVVEDVYAELSQRVAALTDAGLDEQQIIVDPGIGFAKLADHNWRLLAAIPRLRQIGRPLLVGVSRKSFLGLLLGHGPEEPRPPLERDDATAALTAIIARDGVWAVRVHQVRPSVDAVRVAEALRAASPPAEIALS